MAARWLGVACCVLGFTAGAHAADDAATTPVAAPLNADACVAIALATNARIAEAEGKVHEYEARLAEVQSAYYPKLTGYTFLAPMFTVHGNGLQPDVERRWKSLRDWGPYAYLEALLAQPLYTFGRVEAGSEAARERALVERARVRETENVVALEVRRMYYTRLLAASMLPALGAAQKALDTAQKRAQELYDNGTGEVTQVDLAKLAFGQSEVTRFTLLAQDGTTLALSALKHTMGLPDNAALTLADSVLPAIAADAPADADLAPLLKEASEQRPEWAQIEHGKRATLKWEQAEKLANWPVVFVAGTFRGAWSPTRDADPNPYHYDIYNMVVAGAAVGLKFDLDPALASAKAGIATATGEQVEALGRFAATGIPLQVRHAHDDLRRARLTVASAAEGVTATRRWLTFAATAYASGTGEARDLLEGLVASLQAKRTYYENLQGYYVAQAELAYAVGRR